MVNIKVEGCAEYLKAAEKLADLSEKARWDGYHELAEILVGCHNKIVLEISALQNGESVDSKS